MPNFTITIDCLILTDLDLTPTQAEALRGQLVASLQQELAQREWSSTSTIVPADRVRLPDVQVGQINRTPVADIARYLVQALPGVSQKRVGGKQ